MTSDEDLRDVFGLAVTVVSTTTNTKEAMVFFKHLGFPFGANADKTRGEEDLRLKKEKKEKKETAEK